MKEDRERWERLQEQKWHRQEEERRKEEQRQEMAKAKEEERQEKERLKERQRQEKEKARKEAQNKNKSKTGKPISLDVNKKSLNKVSGAGAEAGAGTGAGVGAGGGAGGGSGGLWVWEGSGDRSPVKRPRTEQILQPAAKRQKSDQDLKSIDNYILALGPGERANLPNKKATRKEEKRSEKQVCCRPER